MVTGSSADKLAGGDSVQKFVGLEPSLGVSRKNIKNEIKHWVDWHCCEVLVVLRDRLEN
jgi:hypothetical protein